MIKKIQIKHAQLLADTNQAQKETMVRKFFAFKHPKTFAKLPIKQCFTWRAITLLTWPDVTGYPNLYSK